MKPIARLALSAGLATLVLVSSACNNTAKGLKRDAEENQKEAAQLSADARATAQVAADKASDAANRTAQAATDAARAASEATSAAIQTIDVKAALIADKRVTATGINVDTDSATKTVVLKGHVPNEAQKRIAEQIAAAKAPGYRIKNELEVRA